MEEETDDHKHCHKTLTLNWQLTLGGLFLLALGPTGLRPTIAFIAFRSRSCYGNKHKHRSCDVHISHWNMS